MGTSMQRPTPATAPARESDPRWLDAADAAFTIGHRHRICEDHATAGRSPGGAFAVVSDGCSSSPGSDVGARLLTVAAARALSQGTLRPREVLHAASRAADAVGLPRRALDATLLAAQRTGRWIHVWVCGDGVVASVDGTGGLRAWSIRHPTGAPAYLSYLLDDARRGAYLAEHHEREAVELAPGEPPRTRRGSLRDDPWVWRLTLPAERHPVVAVLSDGAESFHAGAHPVLLQHVLERLLDFKVVNGEFVARRLRRFVTRECTDAGWRHDDDLALAAIVTRRSP